MLYMSETRALRQQDPWQKQRRGEWYQVPAQVRRGYSEVEQDKVLLRQ